MDAAEGLAHVAQLDTFTVPEWFDVVGCSDDPAVADHRRHGFLGSIPKPYTHAQVAEILGREWHAAKAGLDLVVVSRDPILHWECITYCTEYGSTGAFLIDATKALGRRLLLIAVHPPCCTGGDPPLSYQWYRDGSVISGATSSSYTAADSGTHTYNCEVTGSGCTTGTTSRPYARAKAKSRSLNVSASRPL